MKPLYFKDTSGRRTLGTPEVTAALGWLARHQNEDGSWSAADCVKRCGDVRCLPNPGRSDCDAGVTGLALLAFVSTGYSHLSRLTHDDICYGDVVKGGLRWLIQHQDREGCIGARSASKYLYSHVLATLALCEAYGLTGSQLIKAPAQGAVDFLVAARNPGHGWRYTYRSGESDTSVTGWVVCALRSAEVSGLAVPRAAFDDARAWFDRVTEPTYHRVDYRRRGGPGCRFESGDYFSHHETSTATAIVGRLLIGSRYDDPRFVHWPGLLQRDRPAWRTEEIDFSYWYWASRALRELVPGSNPFQGAAGDVLVKNQNGVSSGCRRGSWEPVDRWSSEGGRVYATAINALTLGLPLRSRRR